MQDPAVFSPAKPQFPEQEQLKCPRCESTNTKFCYYNNYNLSQPRHFCKNCRRYWTKGGALRNIPVGGGTRKNSSKRSSGKRANSDPNSDPVRSARRLPEVSPSSTSTSATTATSAVQPAAGGNAHMGDPTGMYGVEPGQDPKVLDVVMGGTFSSLLAANGQLWSIFEGLNPTGSGMKMVHMGGFGEDLNSGLSAGPGQNPSVDAEAGNGDNDGGTTTGSGGGDGENYLQSGEWGNANGWPDLAMYTPGSSFQ